MLLPLHCSAESPTPVRHILHEEPFLTYAPPYRSLADDQLAWLLVRYLHPGSELDANAAMTHEGESRTANFVVRRSGRRVAFILNSDDGPDEGAPEGDRPGRSGFQVDLVVEVTGRRIPERLVDVLAVVAGWEPALFSPDGLTELSRRSSTALHGCRLSGTGSEVRLRYESEIDDVYAGEGFSWPSAGRDEVVVRRTGRRPPRSTVAPLRRIRIGKVA